MKLDILAIGAHPDDVELGASGTILKQIEQGSSVGVVDLTLGELGTRGSAELRLKEAAAAAKVLGLTERHNLEMADGFFEVSEDNLKKLIRHIRYFQPDIVLCNAPSDRHPDHGRGSELASRACFLSGLRKIETKWEGKVQEHWRPKAVYHYIQDRYIEPDFVVDISPYWEKRMESIMAYSSQFFDPASKEPESPISGQSFLDHLKGRSQNFGRLIHAEYGEGFVVERPVGVRDLKDLF
ncbi:bacillithiol biosynthesis deacetylase BshB1 [bacterium SCSIO 12741]|nr:bacillithiol biosynthesis deacetylase BshB1 [bacterium SCSIO 12741]